MEVVLIHGANSSKVCWNWVGSQIKNHSRLEWGMMTDPKDNLNVLSLDIAWAAYMLGI
jgi:murein L,D-transpeptidase YafK